MEKMELWDILKAVPESAKKTISGGRLKGFTDIKPQWRLEKMTETFGPIGLGWKYDIKERWLEDYGGEVSAHIVINLYIRIKETWSEAIVGIGGSMLLSKELKGLYHSDEAYKMALTDALSVALKQLGVGANVYMGIKGKSESKYEKREEQVEKSEAIDFDLLVKTEEHINAQNWTEKKKEAMLKNIKDREFAKKVLSGEIK